MQHRAPGARRRIAGKARRHHQQQRLARGEHGERGEALERPGVGPVDVLDDEEQRRRAAGGRRQVAQRMQRAFFARPGADGRGECAQVEGWRDVEQVVEEEAPLRRRRLRRAGAFDRIAPGGFVARARHAEEAAGEAAHRVTAGLGAEVEDGGGVAGKAERSCCHDEFGDEPRLADARVAAHDDDPAALALGAGLGKGTEIALLFLAADEQCAAGDGSFPGPANPIGDQRLLLALDLDRRARIGLEEIGHLPPGLGADDDLVRPGQAAQARRGVDGISSQYVVAGARIAASRHHQAGVDAGVHAQLGPGLRAQAGDELAHRPVQLQGCADGVARVVAPRLGNAEQRRRSSSPHELSPAASPWRSITVVASALIRPITVSTSSPGPPPRSRRYSRTGFLENITVAWRRSPSSTAGDAIVARSCPQALQNRWPGCDAAPQCGQAASSAPPQALQNRAPGRLTTAERVQGMGGNREGKADHGPSRPKCRRARSWPEPARAGKPRQGELRYASLRVVALPAAALPRGAVAGAGQVLTGQCLS